MHEADAAFKALAEARRVARLQAAVLEWPSRQEEVGPPFAHRISPETVNGLSRRVCFPHWEDIPLKHLALYRLMLSQ